MLENRGIVKGRGKRVKGANERGMDHWKASRRRVGIKGVTAKCRPTFSTCLLAVQCPLIQGGDSDSCRSPRPGKQTTESAISLDTYI